MHIVNDQQICALRELAMARQAYDMATAELAKVMAGTSVVSKSVAGQLDAGLAELLRTKDPREIAGGDVAVFASILKAPQGGECALEAA
ncbi:hypothetical protein [Duganella vulcania]|uniref:Uncharacterized protein n=1 Tax=Duganella vulcania TaxID=2692166 RepID=A0A845GGQ6_9BURK|nr:hypothetical protein [Duganella vulcania]MYM92436.1 hypothetical protein [Duganella vulcania]